MPQKSYKTLTKEITQLNYTELKRVKQLVTSCIASDEVGRVIAEREESVDSCPHCRHEYFVKWGATNQSKQRFKCKRCHKTFTALTNTPLSKMRKPELLIEYSRLMACNMPLRECAIKLDVNLKTAFRWRHKLLTNPTFNKPSELGSIVEADEAFVSESLKGMKGKSARNLNNSKRKVRKVPVLIALDRQGAVSHAVLNQNTKTEIINSLAPILSPNSVLCTDGNLSYIELTKSLNVPVEHKRLIADKGKKAKVEGVYSIQRLNNFIMNWKWFMSRFRGVATKYLDRYLSWYRYYYQSKAGIKFVSEGVYPSKGLWYLP